jgi:hypothetical protein
MLVETDRETNLEIRSSESSLAHARAERQPLEPPSANSSTTAEVLLQSCRDFAKYGQWTDVEKIASNAAAAYPDEPNFYNQWVWAVYRQDRTVEAFQIITQATERFPRSVAIAYTTACLNGALKRVREAKRWLGQAIECANNPDKVKLRSLVQPELQCVWNDGPADFTN